MRRPRCKGSQWVAGRSAGSSAPFPPLSAGRTIRAGTVLSGQPPGAAFKRRCTGRGCLLGAHSGDFLSRGECPVSANRPNDGRNCCLTGFRNGKGIGAAQIQRCRPMSLRKRSLTWRRSTSEPGHRPKRDFTSTSGRRRARARGDFSLRDCSGAERSVMSGILLSILPEWPVCAARLAARRVNVLKRPEPFRKLPNGPEGPTDSLWASMGRGQPHAAMARSRGPGSRGYAEAAAARASRSRTRR